MKTLTRLLALPVATFALMLGSKGVRGQEPPAWGNTDPQQMQQMIQQRMMDILREQLAPNDDAEWGVIEGRLQKVMQLKMETTLSGMGGFRGAFGGGRGGGGQTGGRGATAALSQPGPEAEALQSAVDANQPADQLKSALDKYYEARKRQQAELANAQEQLRQVLTLRQEAILALRGMLN